MGKEEIFLVARGPDGKFFKPICPDCGVPMIHDGEMTGWCERLAVFRCDELIEMSPDKSLDACPQQYVEGDPFPELARAEQEKRE